MPSLPIRRIVIGTPDPSRSLEFWAGFGYTEGTVEEGGVTLRCGRGAEIALRTTNESGPHRRGWDLGPRGLDVYVADLDAARARLADAGWSTGAVAEIAVGPVRMRQCAVLGPANEPVVLVESSHRRPSLLDDGRWCSEVYSVVWCVESRDDEMARFAAAGATVGPPLSFSDASIGPYLDLPVADATLEMVTISDAESSSTRLELLGFPGRQNRCVDGAAGVLQVVFDDGSVMSVAGEAS